jgi:23S rRNA (guanosine2251-2'-O)-methyltransferase
MIVVLDNIRSAYNVGAIIRTCDALGINEVYMCGLTPGCDNRGVIKTALGAENSVKCTYFPSTKLACDHLIDEGYKLVALELSSGSKNIEDAKAAEPWALIVGNEVSGISQDILSMSHTIVHIPMKGAKESLNVSVAFGIAAYTLLFG